MANTKVENSDDIKFTHNPDDEGSLLWRCMVTDTEREYYSVPWNSHKARILYAYKSQDFAGIRFLLVKTGDERYYPLPRLLEYREEIPYFAEQALADIIEALEWEFGVPLPEAP